MEQNTKEFLYRSGAFLMIALGITAVTYTLVGFKTMRFIGSGIQPTNIITVTGDGEVYASPDIANISVTVREEAKKVADAQDLVKTKMNKVLDMLKKKGIAEKDISTSYYSSYPKYEYNQIYCVRYPCPPQRNPTISGYEVSHSLTVKVRDIDSVGGILEGLAELSVTDVSGPNFSIENEDELKDEARKEAITKAKKKAEKLANDLGVDLVRIVNFSENGRGGYPVYALKATASYEGGMGGDEATQIPSGENKIDSYVTITYEIR